MRLINGWLFLAAGCYSLASGIWQADAGKAPAKTALQLILFFPSQRDALRRSLSLPVCVLAHFSDCAFCFERSSAGSLALIPQSHYPSLPHSVSSIRDLLYVCVYEKSKFKKYSLFQPILRVLGQRAASCKTPATRVKSEIQMLILAVYTVYITGQLEFKISG